MKKSLLILFSLVFATSLLAQNEWNVSWKMSENQFQPPQSGSDMAIVKAGFDTDEDGWGEFICATTDLDSNFIMMYEASADNTYELVWYWRYPVKSNTFAGITVGDMDNNGTVEIITSLPSIYGEDANPPRIWVFEWNGVQGENNYGDYTSGISEPHNSWNMGVEDSTGIRPYSLTVEDIDKDGKNELLIGIRAGDDGRGLMVASVLGNFTGVAIWNIEYSVNGYSGGSMYSVTTGDLDGDENTEIYAMLWNMFSLRIIETTGADTYEMQNELLEIYADEGIDYGALDGIRVADVNGDGTNELYIAGTEPENTVFIVTGITDVSAIDSNDVQELYHIPRTALGKFRSMYVADPDKDGKLSLMIAGERNGQVFDLEYKGTGDPADSSNWELTVAFDIFEEATADLGADSAAVLSPRIFYGHPADDMDKDGNDEYVFINWSTDFGVWTGDAYVWVIESSLATGIPIGKNNVPGKITLRQNYPNPFNPETKILYSIEKAADISIVVYDMLGRKVTTLVNDHKQAGEHSVIWSGLNDNGVEAATGTYIYKLKTNGTQISRKMNLIR